MGSSISKGDPYEKYQYELERLLLELKKRVNEAKFPLFLGLPFEIQILISKKLRKMITKNDKSEKRFINSIGLLLNTHTITYKNFGLVKFSVESLWIKKSGNVLHLSIIIIDYKNEKDFLKSVCKRQNLSDKEKNRLESITDRIMKRIEAPFQHVMKSYIASTKSQIKKVLETNEKVNIFHPTDWSFNETISLLEICGFKILSDTYVSNKFFEDILKELLIKSFSSSNYKIDSFRFDVSELDLLPPMFNELDCKDYFKKEVLEISFVCSRNE